MLKNRFRFIAAFLFFTAGFISLFTLLFSTPAHAAVKQTLSDISEVSTLSNPENVVQVTTAKIILADYNLLRTDFAELKELSEAAIDQWLLSKAGSIAVTQARQTIVNTAIEPGEITSAWRPPNYGRALVFETGSGLIDGKGFGSLTPAKRDHGNGLATTGEMIREFSYEKLVSLIFEHDSRTRTRAEPYRTVGSYAVIDWGFDVKHSDGTTSPAGAVLRQAHKRSSQSGAMLNDDLTVKIENTLRRYGLTSAGAHRLNPDFTYELLNIQGTTKNEVIDFGGYLAVNRFSREATGFFGWQVLMSPVWAAKFPQPDSSLKVPFEIWGTTISKVEDPKLDNPWFWSHELAAALRTGHATRADVEKHLQNLLNPVKQRLGPTPATTIKMCRSIL